jgi:branched-chain amino acid transport system substrate-binding protein
VTVLTYVDALQRANSFDTEKVREAIAATNLQTFYGWIKFDETGKNTAKPMVLRQIQKGKLVPVAPSKFAAGEVIYPRPRWRDR